jgi:hypothetical protein
VFLVAAGLLGLALLPPSRREQAGRGARNGAEAAGIAAPVAPARSSDPHARAATAWAGAEPSSTAREAAAADDRARTSAVPGGSVSVRVLARGGEHVPDGTTVSLAHLPPGTERDLSPFARGERAYFAVETREGAATFEGVELGGEIELVVHGASSAVLQREFRTAPRRAGDRDEHVLRLRSDHPVLEFRALDGTGTVLANEELELELHRQPRRTKTDSAGRFRLDLPDRLREGDPWTLSVQARGGSLGARLDLPRGLATGPIAMGDLRLEPAPRLAAGRVVDGDGGRVAGARLTLFHRVREDDGNVGDPAELEHTFESAADGTFEARGFLDADELWLQASVEGACSEEVPVARGAREVELRLLRAGSIAGNVLLDPGVSPRGVQLELCPSGAPGSETLDRKRTDLARDARFLFEGLAPGRYDLALGTSGRCDLARVEGLLVPPGDACDDPRLTLDLRGRLRSFRIVLLPPEPEPAAELTGVLHHRSTRAADAPWEESCFQGSPIAFTTTDASVDLKLVVPGFRTVTVDGVRGDLELLLERAPTLRFRLPPDVRLPAPPLYVKATLVAEGEQASLDWSGAAFDERREIPCRAPALGPLSVRWIVEKRGEDGATATTLDGIPRQYVEVSESSADAVILLTIEDEQLQAALDESEP